MATDVVELHNHERELVVDQQAVWLYTNRNFGDVVSSSGPGWEEHRPRALHLLSQLTTASQVMRMLKGATEYEDVSDLQSDEPELIFSTNALITTNLRHVLNAHPADCGEIGLSGMSRKEGRLVAALVHASRRLVVSGGFLRPIEYLLTEYDVDPYGLTGWMAPSVRMPSYKFPTIDESQRHSSRWQSYIKDEPDGVHVDVHGRTVADLQSEFGIMPDQMHISPVDTGVDPAHHSHVADPHRHGFNGLFFALRGGNTAPILEAVL